MIWHYTERLSAADVLHEGVIRAKPKTLHKDAFARDRGIDTVPVVWFTASNEPDATVLAKMKIGGWPMPPIGDLYRFALPDDYPVERIPDDEGPVLGIATEWWFWTVMTAQMAGETLADTRMILRDVPLSDVIAVEVLSGFDGDGRLTWRRVDV